MVFLRRDGVESGQKKYVKGRVRSVFFVALILAEAFLMPLAAYAQSGEVPQIDYSNNYAGPLDTQVNASDKTLSEGGLFGDDKQQTLGEALPGVGDQEKVKNSGEIIEKRTANSEFIRNDDGLNN
ncbi:MAG: hypothetical protein PVI21_02415 [Candidatus Woesebacteria bacterium]|jgi:hypothetical protein